MLRQGSRRGAVGGCEAIAPPKQITLADERRDATFSPAGSQVIRQSVTGDEVFHPSPVE